MRRPLALLLVAAAVLSASAAATAGPISTGIGVDSFGRAYTGDDAGRLAFDRIRRGGMSYVRISVEWGIVAPTRPATPADPADAAYNWAAVDNRVTRALGVGLEPVLSVHGPAPAWASKRGPKGEPAGTYLVDPAAYAQFARAIAVRYDGRHADGLRVRYFQAWNEPNISLFLTPQLVANRPVAVYRYRQMLEGFASAVWAAAPGNRVVAGGLAPFRDITPSVLAQRKDWGPLAFMRTLLCLSASLKPTCAARVPFDIWAMHPYTSGGPTHSAELEDDVSLGDLPEVRRILSAARASGHIRAHGRVPLWVTEFSWDSSPPDPRGVPMPLLTRWTAEAVYRMWRAGVAVAFWYTIEDLPPDTSLYQSGFYFHGATFAADRAKPNLQAWRFPVVAFPAERGVQVWGRTPWGRQGRVVVERAAGGSWKRLGIVATDHDGIFQRTYRASQQGYVRARWLPTGEASVPFGIRPVADRFFNPFGLPNLLESKKK